MLAESADDGVHARRLGVRAQARRLSAAREQGARRGAAAHAQWQRLHGGLSRDRARDQGASVRRDRHRRRGRRARRAGQAELLAAAAARSTERRRSTSKRAAVELPATFFAFDLLGFEDFDLRPLPLVARKALLMKALPKLGAVRALDHIEREGEAFLAQVAAIGLEGIIAKKRRRAVPRRANAMCGSRSRPRRTGDFVIVGFTEPKGSRSFMGALQLADMVGGTLVYAGRVGTGFNDAASRRAQAIARPDRSARSAVRPTDRRRRRRRFPRRRRRRGSIRSTSARCASASGRRTACCDMPRSCGCVPTRTRATASDRASLSEPPTVAARRARRDRARLPRQPTSRPPSREDFRFSNLKKIYWPADGYTKGDLVDYYRADLAVDVAVSHQPSARDDALPRRHRRQVVLPEGRARVRAGVDSHLPHLERGHAARHQVFRLRRRRVAALRREPRLDPDAHLEQPSRIARAAGLVRDRPRSEGGAVLRRRSARRSCFAGSARRSDCRAT